MLVRYREQVMLQLDRFLVEWLQEQLSLNKNREEDLLQDDLEPQEEILTYVEFVRFIF